MTGLKVAIEGTPEGVRLALARIMDFLASHAYGAEERFSIELVLAETFNNIVEHALADSDVTEFSFRMMLDAQGAHCEVRDQGAPMPEQKLPTVPSIVIPENAQDLAEGGFGWFLIHKLARDLRYRRVGPTNELDFRFAVTPQTPPAIAKWS